MEDNNKPQNTQPATGFGTEPTAPQQPAPQQPAQAPQQPVKKQPAAAPQPAPVSQKPVPAKQPQPQPQAKPPQGPPKKVMTKEELIQKEKARNKKLLIGCGGAFGCGTILLLVLIFVFVGAAGSGPSALAQALGIDQASLVNTLILIVNFFFGLSALIAFILSIGGIFKAMMARKDDKITKKKGYVLSGGAFGLLIVVIGLWVGAWYYLNSLQIPTDITPSGLITEPTSTINLTAPVEVKFDASNLPYDSTIYDIISYHWDFGDGQSGPGSSVEVHQYKQKGNGRYDVKLTLTFRNKNTGDESVQSLDHIVTIGDEQVVAVIKADKLEGDAPLTITFDASESTDPDGNIKSYAWEVDGQGFEEGEQIFTHIFEKVGSYTVKLRVTNANNDSNIAEEEINVKLGNIPLPVIEVLNADRDAYYVGKTYTFDASKTTSPVGDIRTYEWDFGDGTSKERTRTAQHAFSDAGTYKVLLSVTDEDGVSAEQELQVEVELAPSSPVAGMVTNPAKASPDDNFIEGTIPLEVNFDASPSTDPDDDIVDYKWDFDDDGEYDAAGLNANYTFNQPGNFNVSLVVIDSAGFEDKEVILVKALSRGLEATVAADPISGVVPLTVDFDATGSTYADGQIVSFEWDFGDGTPKRSDIGEVTYKYTKIGNFTAKVKVRTGDNKEETAEILISVRQVPLKSCFEPSKTTGDAPLTTVFNPGCSTGTIAKYKWLFGDGESSTEHKPNHTFESPGSYEIVLEIADAQNVVDTSSQFITVTGELTQ
ncbi:PKD domain-containing protein [Patescibacteria group bacterium]